MKGTRLVRELTKYTEELHLTQVTRHRQRLLWWYQRALKISSLTKDVSKNKLD